MQRLIRQPNSILLEYDTSRLTDIQGEYILLHRLKFSHKTKLEYIGSLLIKSFLKRIQIVSIKVNL